MDLPVRDNGGPGTFNCELRRRDVPPGLPWPLRDTPSSVIDFPAAADWRGTIPALPAVSADNYLPPIRETRGAPFPRAVR